MDPNGDRPLPTVDEVSFSSLHVKERIEVRTADGWTLVISRYRPIPQDFRQPILGEPILLVHGFAQNRRAWTSGEFLKNLLFFGADIYVLELRGHGRSSIGLQRRRARLQGTRLPDDIEWEWDIDSYFLYDLPAAVARVREVSGYERIFYCGHSMGGMLGYGYAGLHRQELAGLITIGAASDLGRGFFLLRLIARGPALFPFLDAGLWAAQGVRELVGHLKGKGASDHAEEDAARPRHPWRFRYVPTDTIFEHLENALTDERYKTFTRVAPYVSPLLNPERMPVADLRWVLREGSDREPRRVLEQFARWVRHDELKCYRTGYDFKRGFQKIKIPMAIIFGDRDWLAGVHATRSVYYAAESEYLLWRPVKGNSHLELTMGHDIRQIAYDVKNLVEYAKTHRDRRPSLPRRSD